MSTENESIKGEKSPGQERLKAIEDRRKEKINEYDSSSKARRCSKHNKSYVNGNAYGVCPRCEKQEWEDELKSLVVLEIGLEFIK